jgi:hypothetical protein
MNQSCPFAAELGSSIPEPCFLQGLGRSLALAVVHEKLTGFVRLCSMGLITCGFVGIIFLF